MDTQTINTATNIRCPACIRKLCKIREYDGIPYVEIKHKGAFVLTTEAIVGCIDCGKEYRINAETQSVEEIHFGR